ncbi:MAG: HRDC domain-containing protein [Planctomycetota bacterium]|jgi:superfamily II DNA helicase RecQ
MRVKLITLRYSSTLGGFDEAPLSAFARDKEVVAFREHFYSVNEVPHLTCVIAYQEAVVGAPAAAVKAAKPDPTAELSEPERLLFNTIRTWRAETAREEGVPPYVILTNRQLVRVVTDQPESLTALGQLDGIGASKIERYGAAILKMLHGQDDGR